jgi:hypothetical protein
MTIEPETHERIELGKQRETLATAPKHASATPMAEIGTGITSLLEASKADNTAIGQNTGRL